MNNRLTSFIIRRFLPFLRYEYLRELEAYLRKEVTGFPTVIPPEPFSDRQQLEAYRRALRQTIISGICYRMYGLKKETDRIYRIFHLCRRAVPVKLLRICGNTPNRWAFPSTEIFPMELNSPFCIFWTAISACSGRLRNCIPLKEEIVSYSSPMKDALPFPMITEKERRRKRRLPSISVPNFVAEGDD